MAIPDLLHPSLALPEIDGKSHLMITIAAMEALEGEYGRDYVAHIFDRLDAMTLSVVKTVGAHAVRNCTVDQLLSALTLREACKRLSDALSVTIYGRTGDEEKQKRLANALAEMERVRTMREIIERKSNA